MAVSEQVIEELESRVGVEGQPVAYEIEKGMIRRYAAAVGDDNPRWLEEGCAPPNFILTLGFGRVLGKYLADPSLTVLPGSTELECHQPVRAGDVITVTASIGKVRKRQSEEGNTLFVTFDMQYKNQERQPVAECRQLAIIY
jgi:acyl dehydratase